MDATLSAEASTVQAVVFDLYGTLLTIGQPHRPYRRLLDLLKAGGREQQADDAATVMTTDAGLAGVVTALGGVLAAGDLAALERSLFLELASVRAFDDAVPAIAALRGRGLRVGICSNLASPYAVPARLLLPPMDVYGFSFTIGAIKPDPEIYRAVCAALKLHPSQVLMVGDTLDADVIGPLRLGMRAVHLVRGSHACSDYPRITSLSELLQLL